MSRTHGAGCLQHPLSRALAVLAAATLTGLLVAPPAAADAVRDRQWHLDALNISEAHELTRGQGVTVGVVDSEIEADHPELAGNVSLGREIGRGDSGDQELSPDHGTAVASLIVGHGHGEDNQAGVLGVAPQAEVLPAVARNNSIDPADAVSWLVDQGATVISVSLGNSVNETVLEEAIAHAQAHDVVVVAAAGNVDRDEEVIYPAAYPGVIAVSATNTANQVADISVTGEKVDLAAPGEEITTASLNGGYATGEGTSLATPIVAGTAALVRARYPDMNAASVVNRLVQTATDQGPQGKDPEYGYGIVNPTRALTADIPNVHENPLGSLAQETPATTPGPGATDSRDDVGLDTGLLIGIVAAALVVLAAVIALVVRLTGREGRGTAPTAGKVGAHVGTPPPGPPGPQVPRPGPSNQPPGPPHTGRPPGPPPTGPPGGPGHPPYGNPPAPPPGRPPQHPPNPPVP